MDPSSAQARPQATGSGLAPGSVVGGRFEIERAVGEDALGAVLAAKDQKTGRPIAVRVLAPGLIATREAVDTLRGEVKTAASIQHRNVVATYGMGADKASGSRFIATEWVDGQSLSEVIEEKTRGEQPMSLRGAYNVVAHVCRALEAAQKKGTSHGALRPGVVFVAKSGRVKVANLGIDRAVVRTAGPAALGADEQPFLAPEVKGGGEPDARSDVFGVGGLLYAMLTGRSAADDFVPPSQAHPEAGAEVDEVLLKCLSADPAQRYAAPSEVKDALVGLAVGTEPTHDQEDFGVDIDLDVDIGSMAPPPPDEPRPAAAAAPAPTPAAGPSGSPQVGQRVALDESFRGAEQPAAPVASAEVDLGSLLGKITENDAPRWMVVKDNLDHGPFSGRELVNLILKGEVLGEHGLLNMDTGERRKVAEAPEFSEFVEQWKLKKKEADHKVALERSAKAEKASNVTKIAILAGVGAVLVAGVVVFLITRPDIQEEERTDAELADLYERGEIEISGSAGILPDPPRRRGRRRGRRRAGSGGGSLSYEEAMNQVAELGSANSAGSQRRLTPQQVAGVMNANINRLVPCLSQGSGGGQVRIDLAILGSGRVQGASVRNGTPAFQRCIASRVRQIRFPSFPAPRMGASYTFSAN
ncbi:MAG TPA: protein kinase [Sandaracinaceae bacterium LLY-WYZ-13_1]|nr:protein kinase [Sandaracinaceae bacterium LLY-WYZ-13_1]